MKSRLCNLDGVPAVLAALVVAWGAGCDRSPSPSATPLRGVILFVGDGMGVATVTAARIHRGAIEGRARPVEARLAVDRAPRSALVQTWAEDNLVTDSAAAMTAMMCGEKAKNGQIAVRHAAGGSVDTLATAVEIAESLGLATGIVTTARLTHATPACGYAHNLDRSDEEGIARDLLPGPGGRLGNGMEVVLGGGVEYFLPVGEGEGRRGDGRNLLEEMTGAGYTVVREAGALRDAVAGGAERILGIFSRSHMEYECFRPERAPAEPSLAEMTAAAIEVLRRNPRGFLLMVEGGRIDHALHDNYAYRAVREMLAMDDAVEEALRLGPEEHLVLVTSDHDHTLVVAGYPPAEADVFTMAGQDLDGRPYTSLLFANGPSARNPPREGLTGFDLPHPDFMERAGVPLASETHGGMDVPLYAFGPERFLSRIPGTMENTEVFAIIREAILER